MSQDLTRIRLTVCCAMIAGLLISQRLWVSSERLYPKAPLVNALTNFAAPLEGLLFAALLLALLVVSVTRRPWIPIVCALGTIVIFTLSDQSRLQPWVYYDAGLLVILSFSSTSDRARNDALLMTCRFLIAAVYFWSGVQKANVTFLTRTWIELSAFLLGATSPGLADVVRRAGVVVPLAECAIGIALLTVRFRRAAIIASFSMHATILILLVSAGENTVVWPWNIAMPLLTLFLFWNCDARARDILVDARSTLHMIVVVLFGIMPALSLFGLWDSYLSGALYSGNTAQAVVFVDPREIDRLPAVVRTNTWQRSIPTFIDINRWSYDELNVPAYPAVRVFKGIGRAVCSRYGAAALCILNRPNWRTGARRRDVYDCRDPSWQ